MKYKWENVNYAQNFYFNNRNILKSFKKQAPNSRILELLSLFGAICRLNNDSK